MKTFWKALGIATLAAAVPVRFKKDEETGKKTYQSLLLSVDVDTDESGKTASIGINIGDGFISSAIANLVTARKEAELFTDDPEEAAVIAADMAQTAAEEAQAAADEAQAIADEAQAAADEAQAAADEAQAAVEDVQAAADEVSEADFDPEF